MKKPYCTSLKKKQQKAVFNLLKVEQAAVQVYTGRNQAHNGYTRSDHTGRSL